MSYLSFRVRRCRYQPARSFFSREQSRCNRKPTRTVGLLRPLASTIKCAHGTERILCTTAPPLGRLCGPSVAHEWESIFFYQFAAEGPSKKSICPSSLQTRTGGAKACGWITLTRYARCQCLSPTTHSPLPHTHTHVHHLSLSCCVHSGSFIIHSKRRKKEGFDFRTKPFQELLSQCAINRQQRFNRRARVKDGTEWLGTHSRVVTFRQRLLRYRVDLNEVATTPGQLFRTFGVALFDGRLSTATARE